MVSLLGQYPMLEVIAVRDPGVKSELSTLFDHAVYRVDDCDLTHHSISKLCFESLDIRFKRFGMLLTLPHGSLALETEKREGTGLLIALEAGNHMSG